MKRLKQCMVCDVLVSILVVAMATAALVPAVARMSRSPQDAKCQSNMQRWAEAMELYRADNGGRFPTNRMRNGPLSAQISLSPDEIDPATGKPRRFTYGINWVESLYPYLWENADKTGQEWKSFRRCPNASLNMYPAGSSNHRMHYVFNSYLVEQQQSVMRRPKSLMMIREFAYLTVSLLRPANGYSPPEPTIRPQYPFLNTGVPHGGGSYVLFADGHVKHFTLDYYPSVSQWDAATQQWYNYFWENPSTPDEIAKNKSIAVSP